MPNPSKTVPVEGENFPAQILPEQPPMDDAAGGPTADPEDDVEKLGDFA